MKNKPEAIIVDFFGGSGTTAHAVCRLNRQDGGRRQSFLVTNNEVSEAEAASLRQRGHMPGDPEWETLGIFEHVTRPRIEAAVTGRTHADHAIEGSYKFADEMEICQGFEESFEFFELAYLDAEDVELDLAFESIAPLLWLRAGGRGPVIGTCADEAGGRRPYAVTGNYGVLFDPDRWRSFVSALPTTATAAFVVTDSPSEFAGIVAELPSSLDTVRLYQNYLTTFAINRKR